MPYKQGRGPVPHGATQSLGRALETCECAGSLSVLNNPLVLRNKTILSGIKSF